MTTHSLTFRPPGAPTQPPIDKEVAAHMLLDLAKTQGEGGDAGESEDARAARIIAIETARSVVEQQAQVTMATTFCVRI